MTVSIIIPTYNYGEFIADALHSVEVQTMTDLECIVIDDASMDDTASVVGSFADRDPRFRYIRLDRNSGVSAARDRGFKEAQGEFIQMLDADDVIAPRKLELQVAFLKEHQDTDLVYSNFVPFKDRPDLGRKGEYRADEQLSGSGQHIIRRLLRGNIFRLNTVLFRSSVLDHIGGFLTGFRYAEDWDFWLRIASQGHHFQFFDVPDAISGVRRNPRSLSSDLQSMSKHYLPVLQNLWNRGRLSVRNRVELVLRYALFLLDRTVLRKGPVLLLPEGRWPFLVFVGGVMLLMIPIYPFYKLAQAVR